MASGKTHTKVNYITYAILVFILMMFGFNSIWLGFWMTLGMIVGTKYFGPDLDTRSSLYFRWGFMKWIWVPYQKIFTHRSIFTHGILIGDIVRILYISVLIIVFMIPLSLIVPDIHVKTINFIKIYKFEVMFFLLGIIFASTAHTLTDYFTSAFKRLYYKRAQAR